MAKKDKKNYLYANVKVLSVYDGDTITVEIDHGFHVKQTIKVRLIGIDTPEVRGPEKVEGKKVRDILRKKIDGKNIWLQTHKDRTGKYGRYLATVRLGSLNINAWLVKNGYAKKYLP